jgi:hypothetical protein
MGVNRETPVTGGHVLEPDSILDVNRLIQTQLDPQPGPVFRAHPPPATVGGKRIAHGAEEYEEDKADEQQKGDSL